MVVGENFEVRSYEKGLNLRLKLIKEVPIIKSELRISRITNKSIKCTFTLNHYFRINRYSFPTFKFKLSTKISLGVLGFWGYANLHLSKDLEAIY